MGVGEPAGIEAHAANAGAVPMAINAVSDKEPLRNGRNFISLATDRHASLALNTVQHLRQGKYSGAPAVRSAKLSQSRLS